MSTFVRRNHGTGHSYWEIDGDVETKVPGVTSILSDGIPKNGLTSWAAEQAAQYAIEHWDILGEMGLLDRAKEIQYAWKTERDAAAGRGQLIHRLAQQLLRGELVDKPAGLEGYVESCVRFLDEFEVEEVMSETAVINRAVPYAGTLDLIGDMRGQRWIIDWKTGKRVYSEVALQLAAYARAEHYLGTDKQEQPMPGIGIERGAVVHLRSDGYDVYPVEISGRVYALFHSVAVVAYWASWDKDTGSLMDKLKGPAMQPARIAS